VDSYARPERSFEVNSSGAEEVSTFTQVNRLLALTAEHIAAGRHDEAVASGTEALRIVRPAIGRLEETDATVLPRLQQAVVALSDVGLAQTLAGRPEQAEQPLEQAQVVLERARQLRPMYIGKSCFHGLFTLDPNGACQDDPCPGASY
jgi:hypothetical protein